MSNIEDKPTAAAKKSELPATPKSGFLRTRISNSELFDLFRAIEQLGEYELPMQVSWTVARNKKSLEAQVKAYESDRNDLVEKFGKKNDKNETMAKVVAGGMVVPDFGDKTEEAEKMLEELAKEEVDIDVRKIKYDDLAGVKMKANIIEPLLGFIIDETD